MRQLSNYLLIWWVTSADETIMCLRDIHLSQKSREGKPLFQLGAEVLRKSDRVVMRSTEADWMIYGERWNLSPAEFYFL